MNLYLKKKKKRFKINGQNTLIPKQMESLLKLSILIGKLLKLLFLILLELKM